MGSKSQVTVSGWFASPGNQLAEIGAGGLKISSQVSQLVQAMAAYTASHPGFDPTAVAQAPNDPTLPGGIAGAWRGTAASTGSGKTLLGGSGTTTLMGS